MADKIVLFGAGGHCRTVLSLLAGQPYSVAGIADSTKDYFGEKIGGAEIKFTWDMAEEIYLQGITKAALAMGDNNQRKEFYFRLKSIGFDLPALFHSSAVVDPSASIKNGCHICLGAKIGPYVEIGENCVVYTGSIIDHESIIERHTYISPGCNIAGRVKIGTGAFIGIGATIIEKISIGENAVVGAGSVVLEDVPANTVVAGIPANVKKYIS